MKDKEIQSWLIVDGYNVIGIRSKGEWSNNELEDKRLDLIRDLSEYQTMSGKKVFIVFDAQHSSGAENQIEIENVTVFFTKKGETADEFIERFVLRKRDSNRRIYVATSDYLEQRMIFGQGAYRVTARELLEEIEIAKRKISRCMTKNSKKTTIFDQLPIEMKKKLEKWRRKK